MTILSHLMELRRCLIISGIALVVGFFFALPFYEKIIEFFCKPIQGLSYSDGKVLYINTITEGFFVKLKLSIMVGFFLSSPVHILNILSFVLPGLLKREKQILFSAMLSSIIFMIGGFLYSYNTIIPISVIFLTKKGFIPENTGILLNFSSYIFYMLQFIMATILIFQIPIVLEILLMLNVVKRKTLFYYGRYVIVLIFFISALLTPPDFISQIALALPMTLLYYLTLVIAKIFKFGEN